MSTRPLSKSGIYPQASAANDDPAFASTLPEGKVAAHGVRGVPAAPRPHPLGPGHLTLVHYAELCAAIEARPRRVEELARSFGLATRADLEREDDFWRNAFRRDSGVFELFLELKLHYARRPRSESPSVRLSAGDRRGR